MGRGPVHQGSPPSKASADRTERSRYLPLSPEAELSRGCACPRASLGWGRGGQGWVGGAWPGVAVTGPRRGTALLQPLPRFCVCAGVLTCGRVAGLPRPRPPRPQLPVWRCTDRLGKSPRPATELRGFLTVPPPHRPHTNWEGIHRQGRRAEQVQRWGEGSGPRPGTGSPGPRGLSSPRSQEAVRGLGTTLPPSAQGSRPPGAVWGHMGGQCRTQAAEREAGQGCDAPWPSAGLRLPEERGGGPGPVP